MIVSSIVSDSTEGLDNMKILELRISGFRSLYDVKWRPGNLNIIIGPNGSGKSNLLKVLDLISNSAKGNLSKYIQREGGMDPLIWDGQAKGISIQIDTTPFDKSRNIEKDSLTYELKLIKVGKTGYYDFAYELLGNYYMAKKRLKEEPFKLLERSPKNVRVFNENNLALKIMDEYVPETETLLSVASGPLMENHHITDYQREISGWRIYQDLHTDQNSDIRKPMLAQRELEVSSDGQNLVSVLHTLYETNRQFEKNLNNAMKVAFGDDFEKFVFPPAADGRIQLRIRWKSLEREQSTADLSDGTLRFLFLITVLANPNPPTVIAIDEPETGLHPSMLPIIAELAADAAQKSQIIITTHSAELLDAFTKFNPTTTIAKRDNGKTSLNVVSEKVLNAWIKDYTLGKIFRSGELEELK